MSAHTQGPWTIDNSNGATYINQGNQSIAPITICRLTAQHTIANANLIAAAPELLQALNNLRSAAYWIVEGGEFWGWVMDKTMPVAAAKELDELREMMMQAAALIAKAKGEL